MFYSWALLKHTVFAECWDSYEVNHIMWICIQSLSAHHGTVEILLRWNMSVKLINFQASIKNILLYLKSNMLGSILGMLPTGSYSYCSKRSVHFLGVYIFKKLTQPYSVKRTSGLWGYSLTWIKYCHCLNIVKVCLDRTQSRCVQQYLHEFNCWIVYSL